jgi:hypothetical protein
MRGSNVMRFAVVLVMALTAMASRSEGADPSCATLAGRVKIMTTWSNDAFHHVVDPSGYGSNRFDGNGNPMVMDDDTDWGHDYDWQIEGCSWNQQSGKMLNITAAVTGPNDCVNPASRTPQVNITQLGTGPGGSHTYTGAGPVSEVHNDPGAGDKFKTGEKLKISLYDCNGNECPFNCVFEITGGCE